jgi:hypothetical protein
MFETKRAKDIMLFIESLWRNRLARSAVNRKVGGSSPPRDDLFLNAVNFTLFDIVHRLIKNRIN